METRQINFYKFSELSPEVQKKLIEKRQTLNAQDSYLNTLISESYQESLKEYGYPTGDIAFSLGYSQGDGMAFYGSLSGEELKKVAQRVMEPEAFALLTTPDHSGENPIDHFTIEISRNSYGHHYSHYNTMDVPLDIGYISQDTYKARQGAISYLEDAIQKDVREISKKLEQEGYGIIEDYTSEERAREELEQEDEWDKERYLADGRRF